MPNPDNNPSTHPELNGKLHRYATGTTCARQLRTDRESERALVTLREILAQAQDKPSYSLLMRRAIKVYRSHVQAMKATPGLLEDERRAVQVNSHVPQIRKKKKLVATQQ